MVKKDSKEEVLIKEALAAKSSRKLLEPDFREMFSLQVINETFSVLFDTIAGLEFENNILKDIVLPW